ncbi:hypothetical protein AB0J83_09035 [Actinoplanes sp. NPDC049596]|uniref:hypothetical protein n=1 Tax=unclassified Actinoplanes TaxID=2626549 RepID=UPI0034389DB1
MKISNEAQARLEEAARTAGIPATEWLEQAIGTQAANEAIRDAQGAARILPVPVPADLTNRLEAEAERTMLKPWAVAAGYLREGLKPSRTAPPTDLARLWQQTLADMGPEVSRQQRTLLRQTRLRAIIEDTALVEARDNFTRDAVESRLRSILARTLSLHLDRPIDLAVTVEPDPDLMLHAELTTLAELPARSRTTDTAGKAPRPPAPAPAALTSAALTSTVLDPPAPTHAALTHPAPTPAAPTLTAQPDLARRFAELIARPDITRKLAAVLAAEGLTAH